MDSQIIYDLFSAVIEASEILPPNNRRSTTDTEKATPIADQNDSESDAFIAQLREIRSRLPKPEIGKHGQIMEWAEDYDEREPGHRHISHLFALYPSNQITQKTPELAKAARVTLNRRLESGGGHTGWSRAWIINFWARLRDGEKAYENLLALLTRSTLTNLFDNHPPFQIDGNFGGAAGLAEMLLQSHDGEITLLPALPNAWANGSVKGLCARGGIEADFEWQNGNVTRLTLKAKTDGQFTVRVNGDHVLEGEAKTGEEYSYSFS
jgi:alpha-L-fucosidase 2